jgi:hypothetical protein
MGFSPEAQETACLAIVHHANQYVIADEDPNCREHRAYLTRTEQALREAERAGGRSRPARSRTERQEETAPATPIALLGKM